MFFALTGLVVMAMPSAAFQTTTTTQYRRQGLVPLRSGVPSSLPPDIEQRVLEAQSKVSMARDEFEREKRVKERQRKKQLLSAVSRGKLRRRARAYGYDQEIELLERQMERKQDSFVEATPTWVRKFKNVFSDEKV